MKTAVPGFLLFAAVAINVGGGTISLRNGDGAAFSLFVVGAALTLAGVWLDHVLRKSE